MNLFPLLAFLQNLTNQRIYRRLIRYLRGFLRSPGISMYLHTFNAGVGAVHGYPTFYIVVPFPSYHR